MQSSIERRRLRKRMDDEPVCPWLVLAKCAAGLVVVTLLSVLVASDERVMSGTIAQRQELPTAAPNQVNAEAHRKQVFTQRHQRFQDDAGRRSVVSEAANPSNASLGPLH